MLELVVFDVAGTTVVDDDAVLAAFVGALKAVGVSIPHDEVRAVMGLPKPAALERLLRLRVAAPDLPILVQHAHDRFVERMVDHYLRAPGAQPIPGVETTFQALREEGVRVALDTGFSRRILDAILLRLGWYEDVVDATIASDEVGRGRPYPDMIHELMAACGVRHAHRVAKVGDTRSDMLQGVAAGCPFVVGVCSGTGTERELREAGATHVLPDVSHLPRLMFGTPGRVLVA